MKAVWTMRVGAVLAAGTAAALAGVADEKAVAPQARSIEVCFVLDTTGSMGGLIEGAKRKIWSMANDIAGAKPTPRVKFGLVGYRDRGDEYVTRVHDLTDNLDAIYDKLQQFKADGGGDTPESVNQALHEATTRMSWSTNREVLKIIFLVGDCPPHMDYKDDIKYPETCELAVRKDLIINTVQCGTHSDTSPVWQDIARKAEGSFVAISQSGDMAVVATPVDGDIAKLRGELASTRFAYGAPGKFAEEGRRSDALAAAPTASAGADRAMYRGKMEAARSMAWKSDPEAKAKLAKDAKEGGEDLYEAVEVGAVKVDELEADKLPDELKKMTKEEREKFIAGKVAKRKEIQSKLDVLGKQREDFLQAERKKLAGKKDSFDETVGQFIREQAKRKGIRYE